MPSFSLPSSATESDLQFKVMDLEILIGSEDNHVFTIVLHITWFSCMVNVTMV